MMQTSLMGTRALFVDKLEMNHYMLGVLMLDGFGRELDRTGIMIVDQGDP
jgi:hypothetical protein